MYRRYFQLTKQFTNSFTSLNGPAFLGVSYENHISKRWAGHSKWQNIKSTKEAMDRAKASIFGRISRQIELAVKENGDDMTKNPKLKALWEEAKKHNMPKSTFENRVKATKLNEKPYWTVFSGPKGVVLGLEVSFSNKSPGFLQSKFSQLKKIKLKMEPYFDDLCSEKGIIITDPLPGVENAHERAVDDAIEFGADEVFENDDKTLVFECLPERVDGIQQKLESKGYVIHSASTELDFKEFIKLEDDEIESLESVINKLKNINTEIIRASYNIVRP